MSAPRLISPLLDNFVMGEPIYNHGGVRVLPAMEQEKEEKYIVKIISIPANQSQVDALLITGAYKDADAVNGYFSELADGVIREAGVLNQLSTSGGFDGYENMQVVPMDDGNGYDVYLLAPYRPTWERIAQQKAVTQLDGYNLALDLCAALSVARRNGYLYANLKPESISIAPSGSYHICDLGFIGLDYLQYSSLPTNYFSPYTAPEIADAYSSLNSTMDVYALGMLLYGIFNGGLPFDGQRATSQEYPAPVYADEEFAQIILKAIHPEPAERWQDPTEMGQAIVSVMQRKGVSDAPIIPVVEIADEPCSEDMPIPEEATAETAPVVQPETEEIIPEHIMEEASPVDETVSEDIAEQEVAEETVAVSTEEFVEGIVQEENPTVPDEIAEAPEEVIVQEEPAEEEISAEEIVPEDAQDMDNILIEADKLIADLQIDTNDIPVDEEYEQLVIEEAEEDIAEPILHPDAEPLTQDEPTPKRSGKRKAAIIVSAILIAILLIGGLFFYRHVYLQKIDTLFVNGTADSLSVSVVTSVDSEKLTVICTDDKGNTYEIGLNNYRANFTGLSPETNYTVTLKIDGFHKLFGETCTTYTTAKQTVISDLTVLTGAEEGTANVSFSYTGPNSGNWTVTFKAADEEAKTISVVGEKATVAGLTSGKTYTVALSNSGDFYLAGETETTFTSGPVIKAIDPCVLSCKDGKLTVRWNVDEAGTAVSWVVRCFNLDGFDESVAVNEPVATINVPDDKKAYSIEIYAVGQSVKETVSVSENAITLSDFSIDTSLPGTITITWASNADIPEGGYLIAYTIDGMQAENVLKTNSNSLTMNFAVPNSVHEFTFKAVNGQSVLCEPVTATANGLSSFNNFGIKTNNLRFNLCPRPSKANWKYSDVSSSAYTTTFTAGEKASVVARILSRYYTSSDVVTTLFVFKSADGKVIHTCHFEKQWGSMWSGGYGNFDIPSMPEVPGSYALDMYFDGGLVHHTGITIK